MLEERQFLGLQFWIILLVYINESSFISRLPTQNLVLQSTNWDSTYVSTSKHCQNILEISQLFKTSL